MSTSAIKRTFAESNISGRDSLNSCEQTKHIKDKIHELDISTLREIALHAYTSNTDLADYIDSKYYTNSCFEALEPPKSFRSYTESGWEMLNVTYPALKAASDTTLYELRSNVLEVLEKNRTAIIESAGVYTVWETRRNALDALRKICRNIILCSDADLQTDIVEDKKTLPAFVDAMFNIAEGMTNAERVKYRDEGLCKRLLQLKDECDWVTHVPAFEKLLAIFEFVVQDADPTPIGTESRPRAPKRRRRVYTGEGRITLSLRGAVPRVPSFRDSVSERSWTQNI